MAAIRVFSFTKGICSAELLQVMKVDNKCEKQEGTEWIILHLSMEKGKDTATFIFLIAEK